MLKCSLWKIMKLLLFFWITCTDESSTIRPETFIKGVNEAHFYFMLSSLFVTYSVRMARNIFLFSTSIHAVFNKIKTKAVKEKILSCSLSLCEYECPSAFINLGFSVYFAINHRVFYWITHKAGLGSLHLWLLGSSNVSTETPKCMFNNYLKTFCFRSTRVKDTHK